MAARQEVFDHAEWPPGLACPAHLLLGGDRVNTMHSDIISTLKTLFYSGDRKNYNFDKYCTAHVEQHN